MIYVCTTENKTMRRFLLFFFFFRGLGSWVSGYSRARWVSAISCFGLEDLSHCHIIHIDSPKRLILFHRPSILLTVVTVRLTARILFVTYLHLILVPSSVALISTALENWTNRYRSTKQANSLSVDTDTHNTHTRTTHRRRTHVRSWHEGQRVYYLLMGRVESFFYSRSYPRRCLDIW